MSCRQCIGSSLSRKNPALLAREALTLDHISNGRLEPGIGATGAPLDHSMTGIAAWDTRQRARRFREFVEMVDSTLSNEVTTSEGTYYRVREALMRPAPVQQPRPALTIAAHGPAALKIAAERAESWNLAQVAGRDYYPAEQVQPGIFERVATEVIPAIRSRT